MGKWDHPRVTLRIIPTHTTSSVHLASTNTVNYVCGGCDALLMNAEPGGVHNLVIHCTGCGAYNSTDT
jgi:hypothetical protein